MDAPVTTVLDIDHTPLLAALEAAAGALLVLFGMTGRRFPGHARRSGRGRGRRRRRRRAGRLATQYALGEWWAWTVAGAAALVALVLMLPSRRREVPVTERRVHRQEPVTT